MDAEQTTEAEDKPLAPEIEEVRRRMIRFMAVNLIVVFGLLALVLGILIWRSADDGAESELSAAQTPTSRAPGAQPSAPDGPPTEARFILDPQEVLVGQSFEGSRVSLVLDRGDGTQRIAIIDIPTGRLVNELIVESR